MLTHTCSDNGVPLGELIECFDRFLLRDVLALFVCERILLLPLFDGIHPLANIWLFKAFFCSEFSESLERILNVWMDGVGDALIFIVLRHINIDVNDSCIRGEFIDLASNTIIKAGTCADKQVTITYCPVTSNSSMHAKPVQWLWMLGIKGAHAHESGSNW